MTDLAVVSHVLVSASLVMLAGAAALYLTEAPFVIWWPVLFVSSLVGLFGAMVGFADALSDYQRGAEA